MRKVNVKDIKEFTWTSPKGKFCGSGKGLTEALGGDPTSMDLMKRLPFDVEITRVPAGKLPYPYHAHSAHWEFYQVISGTGSVRHAEGQDRIEPGDCFMFGPGEAHQLIADGAEDLVFCVVADNPLGESGYYPDSKKWIVRSPERTLIRSQALDYYDGEE